MKIAVPTRNNIVDGHFGHCEYYTIFSIDSDNKISDSSYLASPQGCGCKSEIAGVMKNMGVDLMLAGSMGDGALMKLNSFGIDVVRGCSGDVNAVVLDYLANKITDSGASCSHHNGHNHEHHNHQGCGCNH